MLHQNLERQLKNLYVENDKGHRLQDDSVNPDAPHQGKSVKNKGVFLGMDQHV
jgi:hypothetical protein